MVKCKVAKPIIGRWQRRNGALQVYEFDKYETGNRITVLRFDDNEVEIKCITGDGRDEKRFKVFEAKMVKDISNDDIRNEIIRMAKDHFNITEIEFQDAQGQIVVKF